MMRQRGLTGKQLAERASISGTAISLILRGRFSPRRETLSKIIEALSLTDVETGRLMSAYTGAAARFGGIPEKRVEGLGLLSEVDVESPGEADNKFAREIARILSGKGLKLAAPKRMLPTGLMIDANPRIFLVCKSSVDAPDWFEAIGRALYLKEAELDSRTVVVVPYWGRFFDSMSGLFKKHDVPVATPDTIVVMIAELTKPSPPPPPPPPIPPVPAVPSIEPARRRLDLSV